MTTGGGAVDPHKADAYREGQRQGAARTSDLNATYKALTNKGGAIDPGSAKAFQRGRDLREATARTPAPTPSSSTGESAVAPKGAMNPAASVSTSRPDSAALPRAQSTLEEGGYQEASLAAGLARFASRIVSHPQVLQGIVGGAGAIAGAVGGPDAQKELEKIAHSPVLDQVGRAWFGPNLGELVVEGESRPTVTEQLLQRLEGGVRWLEEQVAGGSRREDDKPPPAPGEERSPVGTNLRENPELEALEEEEQHKPFKKKPLLGDAILSGTFPAAFDEPEAFHPGMFVWPNELASHLQHTTVEGLGKEGDAISVGTFRSLDLAAAAGGDESFQVIPFDVDMVTTQFTRELVETIRASPDRHGFLGALFAHPDGSGLAAELGSNKASPSAASDRAFLEELARWREAQGLSGGRAAEGLSRLQSIAESSPTFWEKSFWGSDQAYASVRELAIDDRIVPLNGNLGGTQTLPALAEWLQESGRQVSILDLSNAMDHMNPQELSQLGETVQKIPFSPNARILFTNLKVPGQLPEHLRQTPDPEGFFYYSVPHKDFVAAAERGDLRGLLAVWQFMDAVRAANISTEPGLVVPRDGFITAS